LWNPLGNTPCGTPIGYILEDHTWGTPLGEHLLECPHLWTPLRDPATGTTLAGPPRRISLGGSRMGDPPSGTSIWVHMGDNWGKFSWTPLGGSAVGTTIGGPPLWDPPWGNTLVGPLMEDLLGDRPFGYTWGPLWGPPLRGPPWGTPLARPPLAEPPCGTHLG
jgi:hypothetical protein